MPELFSSRNRMRWHFLSGKYGRTIVPYCLILIALATFGLPPGWRLAAATGQLIFYGLAALDVVVPARAAVKRLTAPFRAFVVLMACALFGAKVFLSLHNASGKRQECGFPKLKTARGSAP